MTEQSHQPNPFIKLALEIGPLAVFFLSFRYGEDLLANPGIFNALSALTGPEILLSQTGPIMLATALFMVAIAVSLGASWWMHRELPRMAVVTGVMVALFGGLTLWLQDETFIKMKPTIVNSIFAVILGFGLLQGKSYLKMLLGQALPLTDRGWLIFTQRWVGFFIFLAILNEVIWRTQSTDFWVSFKTFANLPLTLGFMACQWPLLQRHSSEEPDKVS
ncbi:MAG: septation protein A [Pseudomonadota bacterium]